ncbi:hypothetical protein EV426DRAFT_571151 [Tirmania nivea]|nr:hypothetical protein EV426DRAFT_571151 [Tirmania nivea]
MDNSMHQMYRDAKLLGRWRHARTSVVEQLAVLTKKRNRHIPGNNQPPAQPDYFPYYVLGIPSLIANIRFRSHEDIYWYRRPLTVATALFTLDEEILHFSIHLVITRSAIVQFPKTVICGCASWYQTRLYEHQLQQRHQPLSYLRSLTLISLRFLLYCTPPALLLLCQAVTALPAASFPLNLRGSSAAEEGFRSLVSIFSSYSDSWTLQNVDPTILGEYIFVGVGILCIIFYFRMPKSIKERRKDREYKASPAGQNPARNGEEKVKAKEKQTCVPGNDINRIWIDAIQKDRCTQTRESNNDCSESRKGSGRLEAGDRSLTFRASMPARYPELPPLTLTDATRRGLGSLKPRESHNFGENPNYHDEGFQYSPAHPGTSLSTPPSPFSSRFYNSSMKKVKSHKRSWSTPGAYQTFNASMGLELQSSVVSTTNFPLPTLRPVTPAETMSMPGTPLLASHDEEPLNSVTAYRYSRQYPQAPHDQNQQHQRAQSIALPEICPHTVLTSSQKNICTELDGAHKGLTQVESSVEAVGGQGHAGFQPVMIFEQGQSVTGQKWRRKVTVFRSEILERLEKEGLVIC